MFSSSNFSNSILHKVHSYEDKVQALWEVKKYEEIMPGSKNIYAR